MSVARHRWAALVWAVAVVSGAGGLPAAADSTASHPDPFPPASATARHPWAVTFDDEFDEASLDRKKWSTGWFGDGVTGPVNPDDQHCYDPKQVKFLGDGTVTIEMLTEPSTCNGTVHPYTTGLITSNGRYDFAYGAVEARMYLPPRGSHGQPLNYPALWLDGQDWPVDGELDVMESFHGNTSAHFHSLGHDPGFTVPGKWGGWHTFGAVWQPRKVTYYYDGVAVGTIREHITGSPMYLILGYGDGRGESRTAQLKVDYLRVWQRS